ncbi:undecaprenyldiphospho-muramoylpentapeptide beta-N-acetylglucosaminyltransferase [Leptothrix discophora]|uniref:UDP-N-acetylglucosamine--N-acetylmuramyl-(pentapeptide) pyrophosphoryl-undecaprenol N-acetylglucosamine transferase n=1 Tax=Leptothrix discophora TaxID=89 RepID=A0ABT9FZT0_LEPDI|nr:undecaprenyldiphospho-muramoylpentapeptide beta-N-acetylglucosaminyltransferase [Leptothrix discophora]MDP4299735.1 undecaprenyldiphospho-muramoylpentapeptide beta-N-acetylglucosaminyltransferase [Leptothrix discophora]
MSRAARHLVIMAAGTGGHVMPGLAVAQVMSQRGWSVSWLGTPAGMENRLVPPSGIPLDRIAFAGLRGKGWVGMLRGAVQLLWSLVQCLGILRRRGASAVLGMGGYVCVPGGLVTRLLRRPLVLVNADAALLLSNRALSRWADRIAFGFDGAAARALPRAIVTGNPVRAEIEALAPPAQRYGARRGPLRLLVVGGSLGAQVLNRTLPQALALLSPAERPRVVHQTGVAHADAVRAAYAQVGIATRDLADDPVDPLDPAGTDVIVRPFIDDMPRQLADCDLIVCRAGAITVSELCAAGVASVLVPLVVSTTSHQRDNAAWLANQQAGTHLPQADFTPERLAGLLRTLDRATLQQQAERARALVQPRAAQRVADEIEALVARKEAA